MKPLASILTCAILLPFSLPAQESSGGMRTSHTITSSLLNQERTITVQLPATYHAESAWKYPVLYVLDGESNLAFSSAVATFLAENGLMPEVILVALHAGTTRGRDYLPALEGAESQATGGGAHAFLNHVEQEVIPFVEQTYAAAPLRLISGHSFGGVFVTFALMERPDLFEGYLVQSPYLDEKIGDPLLTRLEAFLRTRGTLDAFYYMNLGDEPDLEANFQRAETMFTTVSPEAFRWKAEQEADKGHMTTRLVGLYAGLEQFFAEDWPVSPAALGAESGSAGMAAHIAELSRRYGYPVRYNETLLAQATQRFLLQRDATSGVEMAHLYTSQYPRSALAHFFSANASAMAGDRPTALEAISTALRLYEADPKPELQALYPAMKRLHGQLTAR